MKVGESAPLFCLLDHTDKERCLDNLHGKWVVLYFYPKDNTSGCTLEALDFTAEAMEFDKLNAKIIGISPDSVKSHKNFISKHDLGIDLLSDPEHKVLEQYGAWQKKKHYGREFMGVVRRTFLINPDGKVEHVWPRVRVKGHVEEVKNKLSEMQGN